MFGWAQYFLANKYFDEEGNDLALMDLQEGCNYELGFEQIVRFTTTMNLQHHIVDYVMHVAQDSGKEVLANA